MKVGPRKKPYIMKTLRDRPLAGMRELKRRGKAEIQRYLKRKGKDKKAKKEGEA